MEKYIDNIGYILILVPEIKKKAGKSIIIYPKRLTDGMGMKLKIEFTK